MTFNESDEWAKGRVLSNSGVSVAKRSQQSDSVIIWGVIVDQTIIGLFEVDEGVKLNSANNCDFMDKTFFALYKSKFHREICIHAG